MRVDLDTDRTGLRRTVFRRVGEGGDDRAVGAFDIIRHDVAGDGFPAFLERQRGVVIGDRDVVDDIDPDRGTGGVAVGIGHGHTERDARDDIFARARRMIQLTGQVEGPAEAVGRIAGQGQREDVFTIRRCGDRLTVAGQGIGHRRTAGGQAHCLQFLRHRQGDGAEAVIAGVDVQAAADGRPLALVGTVDQIAGFAAQIVLVDDRAVRIGTGIGDFDRRLVVVGDGNRQDRRILIAVAIGQGVGEALRHRLGAGDRVFGRREGIAAVGMDRQAAGRRRNRDAVDRIDRGRRRIAVDVGIGDVCHRRAVRTRNVVRIDQVAADRLALFDRAGIVVDRGRHVVDHLNREAMLEDQPVKRGRVEVEVRTADPVLRHAEDREVEGQDVFRRELRVIQLIHQLERIGGIRVQGHGEDRALVGPARVGGRRQHTVLLREGDRVTGGCQAGRQARHVEAEVQIAVLQRRRSARGRAVRAVIDGDQVLAGEVQIADRGQAFLVRVRPVGQIVLVQHDRLAGDLGTARTGAVRVDIGEIDPGDPVVGAVLGRRLTVFRIRNALGIRGGGEDQLIDRHTLRQADLIAALVGTDIGGEIALGDQLTVLIGGPMALLDAFSFTEFVVVKVGDREGDAGNVVVEIDHQLLRNRLGRIVAKLTRNARFRGRLDA